LGPFAWLWGILALAWMEILHFNVLWILDVFFLTISLAGIILFSLAKKVRSIELPSFSFNQCEAMTLSNKECSNKKMEGSDYCSVHRCQYRSESFISGRCVTKRERGSEFCFRHGEGLWGSTESSPNLDPVSIYMRELVAQGYPEDTARSYAESYFRQQGNGRV